MDVPHRHLRLRRVRSGAENVLSGNVHLGIIHHRGRTGHSGKGSCRTISEARCTSVAKSLLAFFGMPVHHIYTGLSGGHQCCSCQFSEHTESIAKCTMQRAERCKPCRSPCARRKRRMPCWRPLMSSLSRQPGASLSSHCLRKLRRGPEHWSSSWHSRHSFWRGKGRKR